MTPRLAICFPAAPTPTGAAMLRRSILALYAQDCAEFEVCVGVDGGDAAQMIEAIGQLPAPPFPLSFTASRRTKGNEALPHRNHARNAAWQAATAPLCWMLDADFILPPHAVRHVLAEHDAAMVRGAPAVLSPCMWQFGGATTDEWFERSRTWAETGDVAAFVRMLADWPKWDTKSEPPGPGVFSGFGDLHTDPNVPASTSVGLRMQEGMPVVWRAFLEAAGGFDEQYIGWGGDKISMIDVLRGLCSEGVVDIRVVTSVVALHQPHPTDPLHKTDMASRLQGRRIMAKRMIESRTIEWKRRIPVLVDGLRAGWKACGFDIEPMAGFTEVLATLASIARRRTRSGAVCAFGTHAGAIRAHMERAGLPTADSASLMVAIDPIEGDWRAGLPALAERLRRSVPPNGQVLFAQRLDGPSLDGLTVGHIQTQVVTKSNEARDARFGGVRYAIIHGKL